MGKRREIWMSADSHGRCLGDPPDLGFDEALALRDEILVQPRVLCQDFGRGRLLDSKSGGAFSKRVEAALEANQEELSTCRTRSVVGGVRRHLTVFLQAVPVFGECPARTADGGCGLGAGRMPEHCQAGPFDPTAPEGLQDRSLLRREGEGGVSRTPPPCGSLPVWVNGRISHPGYAAAYAKRRMTLSLNGSPADAYLKVGLTRVLDRMSEDMPDGSWEAGGSPVLWLQALLLARGEAAGVADAGQGGAAEAADALPALDRWIAEAPGFCMAQAELAERLGLDPEPYRVAAAELAIETGYGL